jgi:hypothetical protein
MSVVMSPDQVTKKYGKLFCKGVYTMVDEKNGVATIIEECIAKGPVEWDAVNRRVGPYRYLLHLDPAPPPAER